MPLGRENERQKFKMRDIWLVVAHVKKNLDDLVVYKGNMSQHCDTAAKQVSAILRCMNIDSKS